MAKKKHKKKHNFKHATPTAAPFSEVGESTASSTSVPPKSTSVSANSSLAYVGRDLRKVVVLATSFIALELVLWYLFQHSALGTKVYGLIKL